VLSAESSWLVPGCPSRSAFLLAVFPLAGRGREGRFHFAGWASHICTGAGSRMVGVSCAYHMVETEYVCRYVAEIFMCPAVGSRVIADAWKP